MIKKFFAKIKELWRRIPLQARVVFNAALIILLLSIPVYVLSCELPLVNDMEARFRLEEKRRLVGPSEIIAVADVSGYSFFTEKPEKPPSFDRLIIAQTKGSVILCGYSTVDDKTCYFNCVPKRKELTIIASPEYFYHNDKRRRAFVLVDNCAEAVRANITITLKDDTNEVVEIVDLSANRELSGCFLFYTNDEYQDRGAHRFFTGEGGYYKYICDVSVELYDAENKLIRKKNICYNWDTLS